jgi:hypothetical protein
MPTGDNILPPNLAVQDKPSDVIHIDDNRDIEATSGNPVKQTSKFSGKYDRKTIEQIAETAKKKGIDPYTALALSMQESGIGNARSDNPFSIDIGALNKKQQDKFSEDPLAFSMDFLKDKLSYAQRLGKKDEASKLQAFNGYGKLFRDTEMPEDGGDTNQWYGIDVTKQPLDMNKNPAYGKRIIDLRENVIKKNPEIQKIVEGDDDKVIPFKLMNNTLQSDATSVNPVLPPNLITQ